METTVTLERARLHIAIFAKDGIIRAGLKMSDFEKQPYYTPAEVGAIFKVDSTTVMNWIHQGKVYALRLGPRTYRIPLAAVMRLANPEVKPTRVEIDGRKELAADERRSRRVLQAR